MDLGRQGVGIIAKGLQKAGNSRIAQGASNIGQGLVNNRFTNGLADITIAASHNAGAAAGKTAARAGIDFGLAAAGTAHSIGSKVFQRTNMSVMHPLGFKERKGLTPMFIGGGIAAGAFVGLRDQRQVDRMGYVYNQGTMDQLSYDGTPQHSNTMGATGDLVFALNKLR